MTQPGECQDKTLKEQLGRLLDYTSRFHDTRAAATGCTEDVNECDCQVAQDWRSVESQHWVVGPAKRRVK